MKWYKIVERERCPLINSIMIDALTHRYSLEFPVDYTLRDLVYLDGSWYCDEEYEDELRDEIDRRLTRDRRFLISIMNSAYAEWNSFEKYCQKLRSANFRQVNAKGLKGYYDKLVRFLLEWNGRFLQFMWLPERLIEEKIKKIIKERSGKSDAHASFLLLTSPCREGFFEEESRKLLEIADTIRSDTSFYSLFKKDSKMIEKEIPSYPKLQRIIESHLERFSWLANTDFKSRFWTSSDLIRRIKESLDDCAVKLEEMGKVKTEREAEVSSLISQMGLNQDEKSAIDTARELVYFRTFRTDIQCKAGYYAYPLFREIASRMGISIEDFHYLLYPEISGFLAGTGIDKKALAKRRQGYAIEAKEGKIAYYYDEKDLGRIQDMVNIKAESMARELKGNTANHGVTRGRVKIVRSAADLQKVREGDVLVTPMTKPSYIIAMEKAAAFVTDEGGITCHAAIISREMKKPCIIGTKTATKVLKDGDLVEVDADRGVVKVIKSKLIPKS